MPTSPLVSYKLLFDRSDDIFAASRDCDCRDGSNGIGLEYPAAVLEIVTSRLHLLQGVVDFHLYEIGWVLGVRL